MPIRESELARYPADWKQIRRRILARDGHACKHCHVPNYAVIVRRRTSDAWERHEHTSACAGPPRPGRPRCDAVRVVLTVAHLNHTPEDCRDDNLAALCQRCHLRHDLILHVQHARATRDRKRGQLAIPGV